MEYRNCGVVNHGFAIFLMCIPEKSRFIKNFFNAIFVDFVHLINIYKYILTYF